MADALLTVLRRNLRAALYQRDLDAAAPLLASLEERDPVSVETRGLALEYLLAAGRLEEAHAAGEQLVTRFPTSARVHYLVGRVAYARQLSAWRSTPSAIATSAGWSCYRLKAFDLAHRLLLRTLPERRSDPKHLGALERSARECGRLEELIARYRELTEVDPRFHGRIRTLERRLGQDAARR